MTRRPTVLGAALIGLTVLGACSSAPAPSAAATPPSAPSASPRDSGAACGALTAFDAVTFAYPGGGDPGAPPPSADELKKWAGTAVAPLGDLAASVPSELNADVEALKSAVDGARKGTPIDTSGPVVTGASNALDKWGHDNCGFSKLDVTGNGKDLPGVPSTLPAGPLSISFANGGAPDKAGFVLLVARVKDGAQYTLDGIRNGSVDFTSISEVVGAAQPTSDATTGYSTATLTPGKYLVVSPIGAPPNFTGTVAAEITVT